MRLPPPSQTPSLPHLTLAQEAASCGATQRALAHVDRALIDGMVEDFGMDGTLEWYHKILKLGRRAGGPGATQLIIDHMIQAEITPDSVAAHLAAADAAHRGQIQHGLNLLAACGAAGAELSTGSFDALIHAAGKAQDRRGAIASYRALRRRRLVPTTLTLNALLQMYTSTGRGGVEAATRLLRRAEAGPPRWPGGQADLCSWTTVMGAMAAQREHIEAEALFDEMCDHPSLRPDATAYNVAIKGRLARGDSAGALCLFARMRSGARGAPPPRTDTFNTLLSGLPRAGGNTSTAWLLGEMRSSGVEPDEYTVCTLLREQPSMRSSRHVWEWARKQGLGHGSRAWHHWAEAHLRHGRPGRASLLLGLARREGVRLSTRSHNLHLRALLGRGDAAAALRHFEAMSAAHPASAAAASSPSSAATADAPAAAPAPTAPAPTAPAPTAPPSPLSGAARWLGRPARPDAHSYSIALTALRRTTTADAPKAEHEQRARRAAELARAAAMRRGGGGRLSAPLVHSLIASCGGDVDTALALWRQEVLPTLGGGQGRGGADGEARRSGLHALLRVCGVGGRADQALRVVIAARKQGETPDASYWSAYVNGRAAAAEQEEEGRGKMGSRLLQGGYERLLQLECAPEKAAADMPTLGQIERIRIRW